MLSPTQLSLFQEVLFTSLGYETIILQDGEENITFPELSGSDLALAQNLLTTFDPEAAEQSEIEKIEEMEISRAGAKQWYFDHPNAEQFFMMTIEEFDEAIDGLDWSVLPPATRNALKLLLKINRHTLVILARREGLLNFLNGS